MRLYSNLLLRCRYALFLASLALSILCSEGWIGPVTCLVALILPPEIKSFGVSLWSAGANVLIMPAGNVIFSIYLTVCCPLYLPINPAHPFKMRMTNYKYMQEVSGIENACCRTGRSLHGNGGHRHIALERSFALRKSAYPNLHLSSVAILQSGGWVSGTPGWLPAARIFLAASVAGGYFVSAAFFLTSAQSMGQDRAKLETVLQTGTLDSVRVIVYICLHICNLLQLHRQRFSWHSSCCVRCQYACVWSTFIVV